VFDGLFGPWHLIILAAVVFVVVGPRKIADQWRGGAETLRRWADDKPANGETVGDEVVDTNAPKTRKRTLSYRLGRLFRKRRT
jgi:Sec-independent protein translocase protein TatA